MAEFKNNQFTNDSNDEHMLRVNMCVTGMTNHPEVGFRGTLVADMTTHRDTFESLENQHADEWGDEQAATAFTNLCEDELDDKLSSARFMVESMLAEEAVIGVAELDIRRDFGIEQPKPRTRASRLALGKKMVETNARYVLELSPYALPEPFFADLEAKVTALETAIDTHATELGERLSVGKAKELERARGDRLLVQAFKWFRAVYTDDAEILLEFGFVPKSQIWTQGQPEPPEPGGATHPDPVENLKAENITTPIIVNKVSWDVLAGANSYSVKKAEVDLGQVAPPMPEEYYAQDYIDNTPVGDNDIMPGKTYYYWVCGVDEFGIEGEWAICSCDYV
ncbi:hypothetical protein J7L01_01080 [bacterium]|nr:hypothetical protein [bacterium]